MSYAAFSTRNTIGTKRIPTLSGQIRFLSGGMGALGQADLAAISKNQTGYDLSDPASWYDITGQLQQANQAIKVLVAQGGEFLSSIVDQYQSLAADWTTLYAKVVGQHPTGLSGAKGRILPIGVLGTVPIVLDTEIISQAGSVIARLRDLLNAISSIWGDVYPESSGDASAPTATQSSLAQTYRQLMAQVEAADKSGNTILAQQLASQANTIQQQLISGGYRLPLSGRRAGLGQGMIASPFISSSPASAGDPSQIPSDTGGTIYIQVTDPQTIAMLQQAAAKNGYDPSVVPTLINSGADAVQIAQAVTQAPGAPGPAALTSELQMNQQLSDQLAISEAAAGGTFAPVPTPPPPSPCATGDWACWFQQNWLWVAGIGALFFLGPPLIKKL